MIIKTKTCKIKDGRTCTLRSPLATDAEAMLTYLKTCTIETPYILRTPEECDITIEQEELFLTNINNSLTSLMIVAIVDGEIAGNCQINFYIRKKVAHRANIGIALISKYWNLGIGTILMQEMIKLAKEHGSEQMELEYIETNERAKALYTKNGFIEFARRPKAFKFEDNSYLDEVYMIKFL